MTNCLLRFSRGTSRAPFIIPALVAGALFGTTLLGGCDQKPVLSFQNLDITGNRQFADHFSLPDTNGQVRTVADYRGKIVVLVFGYTHCPDVCPETMARLMQVLAKLGPDAKQVRILFITVDPARDTPKALHDYVGAFDAEHARGLTGTDSQIEALAKRYRVAYQMEKRDPSGNYDVTHSSAVYVFDAEGRARLLATDSDTPDQIAQDLRRIIETTS